MDNSPWVCHLHWKTKRLRVLLTNRVKYIAFDEENYKNISPCFISLVQTLMWHYFLHQASILNNVCHNKKGQVGIHPSSDSHFSITIVFANLCLHQYIYQVLTSNDSSWRSFVKGKILPSSCRKGEFCLNYIYTRKTSIKSTYMYFFTTWYVYFPFCITPIFLPFTFEISII